jgi:hypothetical protein
LVVLVEVFDAATPARVFRLQRGAESLAAIVDRSGSWGTGREAADLSRAQLESDWRSARRWALSELSALAVGFRNPGPVILVRA